MFEAPRGTHDVLPSEQPAWRRVVGAAEEVCRLYGYRPISTPVFEDTEVFARTSGAGSDVVQKEMYTFEDRGGRSLTLRPEATAPIVRAYLEHGMHREPQPVKLYTVGPMYRYSAPQRGRYREHWQLSVEAIGTDDPAIDAELIALYADLLARLGVTRYELQLNSIGDRECRPAYLERLESWLDEHDAGARRRRAPQAGHVAPARVRHEERGARGCARGCAGDRRVVVRRLSGALRGRARLSRRVRRRLPPRADARPRPRLLHADDVRVRGRGDRRAVVDLRRRALRLSRRGAGGQAHAGHRLRRGHRAAAAEPRRRSARGGRRDRRVLRGRGGRRSCGYARGDDGAPTGRARVRRRLRRPLAQGTAHAGEPARGARGGRRRRETDLAAVVERLRP